MALVVFAVTKNSSSVLNEMKSLCLASASPRRRELLAMLDHDFTVLPVDILEVPQDHESAEDYVQRLAREKATAGLSRSGADAALGSDTVVVCDGQILEKPQDKAHYIAMMQMLSNREHEVLTAVAVATGGGLWQQLVRTKVNFRALSASDIEQYWQTGEPNDKAGGYGIQGRAGRFVKGIQGSYTAVVGLPLCETEALLQQAGVLNSEEKR